MPVPLNPPTEWFAPPEEGIPTDKRITIDADGRVFGYIALRGSCHVGMEGCVTAPLGQSKSGYEFAHQGETLTASGDMVRTAVIPGGIAHAGSGMDADEAGDVYANTGRQLMRVRYGEDANGLWFAGSLFPDVSELDIARIRASSISGDWRWQSGWRKSGTGAEFVGACLVNIPGLPIPAKGSERIAMGNGKPFALVASLFPNADVFLTADGSTTTEGAAVTEEASTETEASVESTPCSCTGHTGESDAAGNDSDAGDAGSDTTPAGVDGEASGTESVEDRLARIEQTVLSMTEPVQALYNAHAADARKREADALFAAFSEE